MGGTTQRAASTLMWEASSAHQGGVAVDAESLMPPSRVGCLVQPAAEPAHSGLVPG